MLKTTKLYVDINTDAEFDMLLGKSFGITLLNVFSEWCGPCISMNTLLVRFKYGEFGDELSLANCNSDTVTLLQRFNRTSVPIWLFVRKGQTINIFVGCESPELLDMLTAEMKYERLGIHREAYAIDQLLPVEIETHQLITEVNIKMRLDEIKQESARLVQSMQHINQYVPRTKVLIMGPHITGPAIKHLVKVGEKMNIKITKRIARLQRQDFYTIHYACIVSLTEYVIEDFIDKLVWICFCHLPETCTTKESAMEMMDELVTQAIQHKYPHADSDIFNLPVRQQWPMEKCERADRYEELVEQYSDTINAMITFIPGMAPNEFNKSCLLEVIFAANQYSDKLVGPDEYGIFEHANNDSENSNIYDEQKSQQKELLEMENRKMSIIDFKMSEMKLFGERGLDPDMSYLVDGLEEEAEHDELYRIDEDSDDLSTTSSSSEENISVISPTFKTISKTIPGIWMPDTENANAAAIFLLYNVDIELEPAPLKFDRKLLMIFPLKHLKISIFNVIERHKSDILEIGIFSSDKPDELYPLDHRTITQLRAVSNDEFMVICLNNQNPDMSLNFMNFKPSSVSPNFCFAEEEATKFFGGMHKKKAQDTNLINVIDHLKKLYANWREEALKSRGMQPARCLARGMYIVPLYKRLMQSRFTDPIIYSKTWYTLMLPKYLVSQGLLPQSTLQVFDFKQSLDSISTAHIQSVMPKMQSDFGLIRSLVSLSAQNNESEDSASSNQRESHEIIEDFETTNMSGAEEDESADQLDNDESLMLQ